MTMSMTESQPTFCFIGFGEAGQAIAVRVARSRRRARSPPGTFCSEARRRPAQARRRSDRRALRAVRRRSSARRRHHRVRGHRGVERCGGALGQAASRRTPYFLDINSVSPGRKQETAKLLGGSARYVDVAVLGPIHPARHQTPMLLAGADAAAVAPTLPRSACGSPSPGRDRRCGGDQDGAQRHDQGDRSADLRMLPRRRPRRRGRGGRRFAEKQFSRPRLDRNSFPTTSNAWPATASAAPPRWKKWWQCCRSSGSSR